MDGKIAVVFGYAPTDRVDTGSCWFVSTPALQGARVAFVRQSGVFLLEIQSLHANAQHHPNRSLPPFKPILFPVVDADQNKAN